MIPRIEQKFNLRPCNYKFFLSWLMDHNFKMLYPERIVSSIYFDNFNLACFHDTREGITPRRKIRIRGYDSPYPFKSDRHFSFEKKFNNGIRRSKLQQVFDLREVKDCLNFGVFDQQYGFCSPLVLISYTREYFVSDNLRVTIDRDIKYSMAADPFECIVDEEYVMEIKTSINTSLESIANKFCFPCSRFSKYERAIEHLDDSHLMTVRHKSIFNSPIF